MSEVVDNLQTGKQANKPVANMTEFLILLQERLGEYEVENYSQSNKLEAVTHSLTLQKPSHSFVVSCPGYNTRVPSWFDNSEDQLCKFLLDIHLERTARWVVYEGMRMMTNKVLSRNILIPTIIFLHCQLYKLLILMFSDWAQAPPNTSSRLELLKILPLCSIIVGNFVS